MLNKVTECVGKFMYKHGNKILIGTAIVGMGVSGVTAVMNTPKAMKAIEDKKEEVQDENLTKKEVVAATWKYYAAPISLYIFSSATIIWTVRQQAKEIAGMTAAYDICRRSYERYREKVVETIGEQKEAEVCQEIEADKIRENPPQPYCLVDDGRFWCLDDGPGIHEYYRTTMHDLDRGVLKVRERLNIDPYLSENEVRMIMGMKLCEGGDHIFYTNTNTPFDYIAGYAAGPNGVPAMSIRWNQIGRVKSSIMK